jgi:hypothetical protein
MDRDGTGVSALLGLGGFVVRGSCSRDDGQVVAGSADNRAAGLVPVLRRAGDRPRTPLCGSAGPPIADRPVVLVWAKRLWRCATPATPKAKSAPPTCKELLRDTYLAASALEARRRLVALYDYATPATYPSSNASPAPSPAGRHGSCAGTTHGSPTPPT